MNDSIIIAGRYGCLLLMSVLVLFESGMFAADGKFDLSKVEHFPHKGRVQDKTDGGKHLVINELLQKNKEAILLLIDLLDDDAKLDQQVICYWPRQSVGDIALVILTDFFTDSTWTNATIPGASWNEILESKPDANLLIPTWHQLDDFKNKRGSKEIRQK